MSKNMFHQKLFVLMIICIMICGILLPIFSFSQSMTESQKILKPAEIRNVILKPGFERHIMKKTAEISGISGIIFWGGVFIYGHCKDESRSSKKNL